MEGYDAPVGDYSLSFKTNYQGTADVSGLSSGSYLVFSLYDESSGFWLKEFDYDGRSQNLILGQRYFYPEMLLFYATDKADNYIDKAELNY